MMETEDDADWSELWDARLSALESVLGKWTNHVLHGVVPFEFGFNAGGRADVIPFENHLNGVAYVTADLIGCEDQISGECGNYELMICHREKSDWGPGVICRLAYYTLDEVI